MGPNSILETEIKVSVRELLRNFGRETDNEGFGANRERPRSCTAGPENGQHSEITSVSARAIPLYDTTQLFPVRLPLTKRGKNIPSPALPFWMNIVWWHVGFRGPFQGSAVDTYWSIFQQIH